MTSGPEQLRDWMERREFNNEETATYLGIDASVVTKLANGSRNAGLKIALVIERKTGIPVESWVAVPVDKSDVAIDGDTAKSLQDK